STVHPWVTRRTHRRHDRRTIDGCRLPLSPIFLPRKIDKLTIRFAVPERQVLRRTVFECTDERSCSRAVNTVARFPAESQETLIPSRPECRTPVRPFFRRQ